MKKQIFKISFLFVMSSMFFYASKTSAALNVPLTVQETLPAGVNGLDRDNENFASGIPLPEDSGITNVDQLGLSNSSAGQFRALAWWPNGNIKWVLVDGQASVVAGQADTGKALINGSGNFGGSDLAVDNGNNISIDTGNAQFTIKKANFNVFDSVVANNQALVSSGNNGRLSLIGDDSMEYVSSNDNNSTAVIEENGPLRAVIKSTGSFKKSSGVRFMDYTVRMHFYKGKTNVKGVIELRNASQASPNASKTFKSIEAIVPLNIGEEKNVSFAKNESELTGSLANTDSAYLFQGFATGASSGHTVSWPMFEMNGSNWNPPLPGSGQPYVYDPAYTGVKIKVGDMVLNESGNSSEWGKGTAHMEDGEGKGVTLAFRNLPAYFPGGFEFKGSGEASAELYSKQNIKNIKMGFGQHNTREVMWDFYTSGSNDQKSYYQIEYPLMAKADFGYYAQTGAMYGQKEFVTSQQQTDFFNQVSKATAGAATNVNASAPNNPSTRYVWRNYTWSSGGGWNQNNHVGNDLLDYLRTGGGGYLIRSGGWVNFIADSALGRSDDFSTEILPSSQSIDTTTFMSGLADGEHTYFYGLPLYYYLSGNESAREAWLDYGDRLLRNNLSPVYYNLPYSQWLRGISNTLRNTASVFEFSCETGICNNALKSAIEGAITYQIDSRDEPAYGPGNQGRNLERGYIYWDVDVHFGGLNKRVAHSLYHNHIHFEALYQTWRILSEYDNEYPRLQEMEDYMTGLAKFYLEEWFEETPSDYNLANATFNFPYVQHYDFLLDEATPAATYPGAGFLTVYSVSRASLWAYEHSGIQKYLDIGKNLVWEQPAYSTDSKRNPSELQDQAMMYEYFNVADNPIWTKINANVVENGGGSYTLSWAVPAGAQKYQIKYAEKPIVEWLGFDPDSRVYQYDPTNHVAFFAANNISESLAPQAAGTTQSYTITGLDAAKDWNFTIKVLTAVNDTISPAAPSGLSVQ